jgi:cytochrome P450
MPPHNFLFGHIHVFGEIMAHCLPDDAHGHYFCRALRQAYPDLPPNFYVDLWPLGGQLLLVSDPNVAYQCTVEHSLPKALALKMIIEPFTGGKDLVTMEGNEWKTWRAVYNPGFAAGHLMTMVRDSRRRANMCGDFEELRTRWKAL